MPFGLLIYFKFSNEILKRSDFLNEKIAKSKQKEINDSINYAKKNSGSNVGLRELP